MKTVRRLFYADIASSVAFVALAFLSLFFFIDFVDELADVGSRGYTALHAALYSLLLLPGHLYELSPIAVLIGSIYALSRMAQSSEYTILRTGGLGPGRALSLLASLGLMFGAATYLVGDHLAPLSERHAAQLQPHATAGLETFSHIEVVFLFDRVETDQVCRGARHPRGNPAWPMVGILARRAKDRPNRIGLTTRRVMRVDGLRIEVAGLDAIEGTPVLDIKPAMSGFASRGKVREPALATE